MNRFWKSTACLILPCFLLLSASAPLAGAQQAAQGNVGGINVVAHNSDGGDDYSDKILIGMFVVVVGILLYLGWQSDRSRMEWSKADIDQSMARLEKGYTEHEIKRFEKELGVKLDKR